MEPSRSERTSFDLVPEPWQPCLDDLDARSAAKVVARQRQDVIAGQLSRLVADEYLEDMLQHLQVMEEMTIPDVSLIDLQRDVQWFMRPFLIDFLIEAHGAFALLPETLFLTINLLDRYCSRRVVYKNHYQLVGCAALLIAAKYGDKKDRVPQISELSNMCCGLYDPGMFTQMEMHVLNNLDWTIGHPTADFFTQLLVACENDDKEVDCMTSYLCEMALYHREFVSVRPSTLATVSITMARAILGRPEKMKRNFDEENQVAESLSRFAEEPSPTLSAKYSSLRMYKVAHKLAEFIAMRAAAATAAKGAAIYSTPQKGPVDLYAFEGYLTPPITPDGAFFGQDGALDSYPLVTRPTTPSPAQPQPPFGLEGNQYAQKQRIEPPPTAAPCSLDQP